MRSDKKSLLRLLPSIDALLKTATARKLTDETGAKRVSDWARSAVEVLRGELENQTANGELTRAHLLVRAEKLLLERAEKQNRRKLRRVINATGVVLHTNLGRAPLADGAKWAVAEIAANYCTLEYDLETGARGRRGAAAEELLCELTGAEAAIIVNNCAAAAFLVLSALGAGGEAIVSRGELVEIGGDFRVPDVMAQSGVRLAEVGTTNRTRLKDFAAAVNENTKLFVRVHPSNFRIVGFTAMPGLSELSALAHEKNILLYEDAGSGALVDLSEFGLTDEPIISESIAAGADVVTFSGDKLLGGCQAGLIVGRAAVIETLRKHPLYRALRVDKTAYAILAATLELFQTGKHFAEIPALAMLSASREEIERRAREFVERARQSGIRNLEFEIIEGASAVGGGSAPLAVLETVLIAIRGENTSSAELEKRLRFASPPIIVRVADDRVLLDLRTVAATETDEILATLQEISG